jgi:hypothetical protein
MPKDAWRKAMADVIYPLCGKCGADPIKIKRLRYDFEDGVLVETLFCADCRAIVGAQIVGIEKPKRPYQETR